MPRPLKPIVYVMPDGPVPAGRPGIPNPIDVHLGSRMRMRRIMLGMSQQKLGELLGLTFQQIQKYERGANRVGASRLWDLSRVLDVQGWALTGRSNPELRSVRIRTLRQAQDEGHMASSRPLVLLMKNHCIKVLSPHAEPVEA